MKAAFSNRVRSSAYDLGRPFVVIVAGIVVWLLRSPLLAIGGIFAGWIGYAVQDFVEIPALQGVGGASVAGYPSGVGPNVGPFGFMNEDWTEIPGLFGTHLQITFEAVIIALLIAIPIGIAVHRLRWLNLPVVSVLDGIYVLPSLAVFPVVSQFTGLSNTTAIIGLVAYAQFILVRNVVAGLESVPPEVKEAARGMGMSKFQILLHIELPLATPIVAAGLRIATVAAIGIAAVAGLFGIPDLGSLFFRAVNNGGVLSYPETEAAALAVIVLALGADMGLRLLEYFIPANRASRAGRHSILFGRLTRG